MKTKLLFATSIILTLFTTASAQENLLKDNYTIVSEIEKLPNGEIPAIVVNAVDIKDEVKEVNIYPLIEGKAKVVIKFDSPSNYKKSNIIKVISSTNM